MVFPLACSLRAGGRIKSSGSGALNMASICASSKGVSKLGSISGVGSRSFSDLTICCEGTFIKGMGPNCAIGMSDLEVSAGTL